ncbi:MAG: DJ-1/PfpI family protein [Cyanobium sp.]|uniref:DJ-1/PfpI family protein n=1 Tax=Synechococcus sp. CS-1324 TaxID=2847980 RepID=UPI000DB33040|nr:DJ-1/PfpI family protein [Synechococcus sp. CS-1324]PZV05431.1 MAG: DJ-1/PfpI family protein [Cyanobium sp.]
MQLGILVYPQVEELDVMGPWEMVTTWSQLPSGPSSCRIVAESTQPLRCAKGLSINPDLSFASCAPLDVLIVPGGQGSRREVDNPALIDFLARQASQCQALLSVCTGAFLLHAAGLLSGRIATTHWGSLDRLRALGDVTVVEERFTRDGRIWCSAGVSAGIDLTLRYIAATAGEAVAGQVQLATEYFPSGERYGNVSLNPQAPGYLRD